MIGSLYFAARRRLLGKVSCWRATWAMRSLLWCDWPLGRGRAEQLRLTRRRWHIPCPSRCRNRSSSRSRSRNRNRSRSRSRSRRRWRRCHSIPRCIAVSFCPSLLFITVLLMQRRCCGAGKSGVSGGGSGGVRCIHWCPPVVSTGVLRCTLQYMLHPLQVSSVYAVSTGVLHVRFIYF
jgi:hypothetical protein